LNRRTDSVSCRCASVSRFLRGWAGSGRRRPISMKNAPVRRRRPACSLASLDPVSSGNEGAAAKVRAAASSAACAEPLDALLDFGEELSSDVGFFTAPGVEGDGDAVSDTLLKLCQIR